MKLAQILLDGQTCLCAVTPGGLRPLTKSGYRTMQDAIERPEDLPRAQEAAEAEDNAIAVDQAHFLPVIERPGKIICVGVNYQMHANECGHERPQEPVLFSKFPTALSANNHTVAIPHGVEKLDYEAELVLVIGKRGKNIPKEEAMDYIFGCTCGNDLSARDWQHKSSQWMLGKTPDGFAPVGPWVATTDSMHGMDELEVACAVNGELRQYANITDMIFDCDEIVSYVSQAMTLEPGDLIFTGTPDGVIQGKQEKDQQWLKPGDVVEVAIERIGTLRTVIGERE